MQLDHKVFNEFKVHKVILVSKEQLELVPKVQQELLVLKVHKVFKVLLVQLVLEFKAYKVLKVFKVI